MIIKTDMSGKGFITHEDQTVLGLKFRVLAIDGITTYVDVTGDAREWVERVKGVEVTQSVVDAVIAAQLPDELTQIRNSIESLKMALKADIGFVAVDIKTVLANTDAKVG